MKLRHTVLVGTLLCTVLPLGVSSLLVYRALTPFLEESTVGQMSDFVDHTASTLDAFMLQRSSEMRTFATEPILTTGTPGEIARRLEQLSLLTFFFDDLYFTSTDGQVVASTEPRTTARPLTQLFPELGPHLDRVRRSGASQVFVSDFSDLSPDTQPRVDSGSGPGGGFRLQLLTPVFDRIGRTRGVLVGVLGPHVLDQYVEELDAQTPGPEPAYLLTSSGRVLAASGRAGNRMALHPYWRSMGGRAPAPGYAPLLFYRDEGNRKVVTAVAATRGIGGSDTRWILVASAPYDLVMAPALAVTRKLMLLLVAVLGTATFVGLAGARSLVRRIELMTRAVRRFGDGDLDARVPVAGSDELALLGRTLNGMAAARQEALESERLLIEILEATPDFVGFADAATAQILYINPAGRAMTGIGADESLEGQKIFDVHPEWTNRLMREAILPAAARAGMWVGECAYLHRDGHEIPVLMVLLAHNGADGRIERFSTVSRDMTARLKVDEELRGAKAAAEAATVAKSEFLATMSHEIRTPMNGIIGTIGLLLDSGLSPHQRELAGIARASADTLLRIINDILDASKIEVGRMTIEPAPFDLCALVEEVAEMFAVELRQNPVEVVVRYAPACPRRFVGDAGRIRQVLVNLVGNAAKFTEAGHIVIEVTPPVTGGPGVRVSVRDTGIGLAPEAVGSLFERFVQADASTTRRFGGSGLGLSISRSLVELMGGAIGANGRPGEGSTFWFTLPLPPDPAPVPPALPGAAPLAGLRVLVVDDHPVNRQVLAEQVTSWDARADVAGSGGEALRMLREAHVAGTPYDVAILDHQMPGMDGVALGALMQADADLAPVMRFLLTSLDTDRSAMLRQGGFRACFTKPVRASVLFDGLARAWEARREGVAELDAIARPAGAPPIEPRFAGRVLVADDNATNVRVAQLRLESVGCTVDSAGNGREVLELLKSLPYDLVLMDCEMPEMDGFAATAAIRAAESTRSGPTVPGTPLIQHTPRHRRLPIVAMTASAMAGDRERCLAAGMDDYLSKPLDVTELVAVLRRWLVAQPGAAVPAAPLHRGAASGEVPGGDTRREAAIDHADLRLEDPLDRATLADLQGLAAAAGGPGSFVEILEGFRREGARYVEALRGSVDAGDRAAVRTAAHTLKGASASVGAVALSAAARALEMASRDQALEPLFAEVAFEFGRAQAAVERLLEQERHA